MTASFQGFLTKYCKELTSSDTTSLKKLFALADSEYPRAYEPLLLLAVCNGREDYLLKQARASSVFSVYSKFLEDWEKSNMPVEEFLLTLEERNRFRRPLTAWLTERGRLAADREMLVNVASTLSALLKTKGISRAHACKLTNVNKGNFYAFLKGDTSKLSRKTAMHIYRQLSEAELKA